MSNRPDTYTNLKKAIHQVCMAHWKAKLDKALDQAGDVRVLPFLRGMEMAATYHSIISTVKMQGRSVWEYLGKFFTKSLIKRTELSLFEFLSVKTLSKSLIKRIESNLFEFLSVKALSKIFNGCRDFFSMRPDAIFVQMSAEPNLFELCRVQPKIMK